MPVHYISALTNALILAHYTGRQHYIADSNTFVQFEVMYNINSSMLLKYCNTRVCYLLHYYTTHYYTIALLHYCTTTLLHYYTTILLHYCTTTLLHYTLLHYYTITLLHYCTTTLLHYSLLHYYTIALLHYYTTTLLHYYTTTLLHYYTITLLHYSLYCLSVREFPSCTIYYHNKRNQEADLVFHYLIIAFAYLNFLEIY